MIKYNDKNDFPIIGRYWMFQSFSIGFVLCIDRFLYDRLPRERLKVVGRIGNGGPLRINL